MGGRPGHPSMHDGLLSLRPQPCPLQQRWIPWIRAQPVEPRINLSELLRANGRAAEAVELLREGLRVVPRQPLFEQRLSALGSASTPPARGR